MIRKVALIRHAALAVGAVAAAASGATAQVVPDMVSRTALRVCADPANMPFSDRDKQGFENKIADIVAEQLKEPVRYLWAPSGPGFARNTLNSDLCDIVIGYAVGSDVMQSTNPYYRSTYVLVTRKGDPLAAVKGLGDPLLRGRKLGVFAATPPVDVMLKTGLMDKAKVYALLVDHRFDSPLAKLIEDLRADTIDAAIVWGPLVGLDVKNSNGALVMSPLVDDAAKPGFSYRISFGIRHDEPDWKHKLEGIERARAGDIGKVLVEYNVPLLSDDGTLVAADEAVRGVVPSGGGGDPRKTRVGRGGKSAEAPSAMPGPAATPQAAGGDRTGPSR